MSIETYDGIDYYHYKCASQLPVTNNLNLSFQWVYDGFYCYKDGFWPQNTWLGEGYCTDILVNGGYRIDLREGLFKTYTVTLNINGNTVKIRLEMQRWW